MDEKTLKNRLIKNRLIKKKDMLLEREEKPLLLYLNSLHEETIVEIYIKINNRYRLITANKTKELLWCLSQGVLATHFYFCGPNTSPELNIIDIYIQELA